jgi:hypothetical protein
LIGALNNARDATTDLDASWGLLERQRDQKAENLQCVNAGYGAVTIQVTEC